MRTGPAAVFAGPGSTGNCSGGSVDGNEDAVRLSIFFPKKNRKKWKDLYNSLGDVEVGVKKY